MLFSSVGIKNSSGSGGQNPERGGQKLQEENGKTGGTPQRVHAAQCADKGFEKIRRGDE